MSTGMIIGIMVAIVFAAVIGAGIAIKSQKKK